MLRKSLIALALASAAGSALAADAADFLSGAAQEAPRQTLTLAECQAKSQAVERDFNNIEGYVDRMLAGEKLRMDPLDQQFTAKQAFQCAENFAGRPLAKSEQAMVSDAYSDKWVPGWLKSAPLVAVARDLAVQVTASGQCVNMHDYETARQCVGVQDPSCSADYRRPTLMHTLAALDNAYSKSRLFSKSDFCPADAKRVMTTVVTKFVEQQKKQPLYQMLK